jgi:pimeloyl-ACP methyl ester carboxylesterase
MHTVGDASADAALGRRARRPSLRRVLFIAGTRDGVIASKMARKHLEQMGEPVPLLRARVLIEGGGHWIQ